MMEFYDLGYNPPVMFQYNNYWKLIIFIYSLTVSIPCLLWSENLICSICTVLLIPVICSIASGSINSLGQTSGHYTIKRLLNYLTLGADLDLHYAFPDHCYGTDLKWKQSFDVNSMLIDFGQYFGWIYDKKVVDPYLIDKRLKRTQSLSIKRRPCSVVIDYGLGLIVFTWSVWPIVLARYFFS